jgi:ankyrin repeat protein
MNYASAAYHGVLEIVELFLTNKASADSQNAEGWTPLHAASEQGHMDIVQFLVKDSKAKVNVLNKQGTTPLYHAVTANKKQVVAFLLKHGADVNLGKKGGWKPLHSACRKVGADIVRLLVEYNAEIDEANEEVKVRDAQRRNTPSECNNG